MSNYLVISFNHAGLGGRAGGRLGWNKVNWAGRTVWAVFYFYFWLCVRLRFLRGDSSWLRVYGERDEDFRVRG